jgi:hypothetical protein
MTPRQLELVMRKNRVSQGVQEIELESWEEYPTLITGEFLSRPAFIYRGQVRYDWKLESSIDRYERLYPKRKNQSGGVPDYFNCPPLCRSQHLNAFRHAIRGKRGFNAPGLSDDQCWALGQHYGLKTPLLDWTLSPFAALFFAFEQLVAPTPSEVSRDNSLPSFRGVYAFSTSALEGHPGDSSIELLSPETEENIRLFGQAGVFLRMPRAAEVETWVRERYSDITADAYLIKLKIPDVGRDKCLQTLSKMNINYMTVYPDLEGAAKHVNSMWQPGYEDLLPWLQQKAIAAEG